MHSVQPLEISFRDVYSLSLLSAFILIPLLPPCSYHSISPCVTQAIEHLAHFCSRDAANIDGLGPAKIKDLFDVSIQGVHSISTYHVLIDIIFLYVSAL